MKASKRGKTARAAGILFAAIAAAAITAPSEMRAEEETPGESCAGVLEQNYGAMEVNIARERSQSAHHSVYADATRPDGQVIRFRCLRSSSGKPKIQVYAPGKAGTAMPWARWGDAEDYRMAKPAEPEAAPPPEDQEVSEAPSESEPEEPEGPRRVQVPGS